MISDFEIAGALRGFRLPTYLLLDLPVGEQILVTASRALPGPLNGIGTALVEHLHDQVAMKTHGGMAKDQLCLRWLCANCHMNPPFRIRTLPRTSTPAWFTKPLPLMTACKNYLLAIRIKKGRSRLSCGFIEEPERYYRQIRFISQH